MLIRRSNLIIPVTESRLVRLAWGHDADAITLDLQDGIPTTEIGAAREALPSAICQAGKGAADVFVRINAA